MHSAACSGVFTKGTGIATVDELKILHAVPGPHPKKENQPASNLMRYPLTAKSG